jgi:hypothetical protein
MFFRTFTNNIKYITMKLYHLKDERIKDKAVISDDLSRLYRFTDNSTDYCQLREYKASNNGWVFMSFDNDRVSFNISSLVVDYDNEFDYERYEFKFSKSPYCSFESLNNWLIKNDARRLPSDLSRFAISRNGKCFKLFKRSGELYPKEIKPNKTSRGYMQFSFLICSSKKKYVLHHRLLAYMFLDLEWDSKLDIDHINGIKDDNRIDNIRVCSRKENLMFFRERVLKSFIKNGRDVSKTARAMNITKYTVSNSIG